MHDFVSFNLQISPAEKTFISTISTAALYGKGVFTTLAILHSKPFLWQKHWRRLTENAARLDIDLSNFSEEIVRNAFLEIIAKNKIENARARLTFFDKSANKIWNFQTENNTSLLITTAGLREPKDLFRLTISPFSVNSKSPLANIKSCNYLENLLALEEAQKRGFDETIRLNETGKIASAAMANVFWIKDEKIFTASLKTGCLAGTMREFLLENFEIFETEAELQEIIKADEIFLTSSGIGVQGAVFEDSEKHDFAKTQSIRSAVYNARVKF